MAQTYLKKLLGENETILFTTRQHWLVLVGEILSESILSIVFIILVSVIWAIWLPNPLVAFAYLVLIFPLISMLRDVLVWANRQYVVTNWRVIQMSGVFNKDVTDSSLEKVNDVKLSQSVSGRMFDYGDIEILTASELGVNKFKRIGRPIHFKTAMLNAKEKLEKGQSLPAEPAEPKQEPGIPGLLAQLDNLRKQGILSEEEFQAKKTKLLEKI